LIHPERAVNCPLATVFFWWYGRTVKAAPRLDFCILGSVEVRDGDRLLAVGGGRQKALLALLLIHRGEARSTDRLIDALWGAHPPPSATNSIHVYVSNLRKVLGDGRIETRERGYSLQLDPGELDFDLFESLLAAGREQLAGGDASAAAETLARALALWRGPPLSGLEYADFAQTEIARLTELRLSAVEERVDADLTLGRAGVLVPELERLVRDHPLRERLRSQLMLALYRSGRQADALATYRDARRLLVDELGLEPGRELQELERRVLTQDPALAGPAPKRAARRVTRRRSAIVPVLGAALVLAALGAFAYTETDASPTHVTIAGNAVAIIDPRPGRVVDAVPVGARPAAIAYGSGSLWVANLDDETVSRVDVHSRRQVREIRLGYQPTGIAAGRGAIWVVGSGPTDPSLSVGRIDPQFDVISRRTRLGNVVPGGAGAIAASPATVWAAPSFGLLTRLDATTGRPLREIDPNTSPTGIALGADAVWLTDSDANAVVRVDRTGLASSIAVGHGPSGIAVGAGAVWVADTLDDAVVRIDPSTGSVSTTIAVGSGPTGVAIGAGAVWVANSRDGTISRIDPATSRVTRIRVGGSPQRLVVAAGRVWVTVQPQAIGLETKPGGTARVASQADVDSMDPGLAYTGLSWQLLYATCARLLNYPDRPAPEGSQLVPEVAASLPTRSQDGRAYTFTIRKGFRFSPPSNETVTAQTFKYTIERSLSPRMHSPAQNFLRDVVGAPAYMAGKAAHVAGVAARGDTLTIRLTAPAPDFPTRIALPFFCAVPSNTPIDPKGVRAVPSAGPYYVASYTPGQGVLLERNPVYHGSRPHRLQRIVLTIGAPQGASVRQIETGALDYSADGVPLGDDARLEGSYGRSSPAARAGRQQYFIDPLPEVDYLALNTGRRLFSSVALRRAVSYAVDRRALARLGNGFTSFPSRPSDQYLPPGVPGFRAAPIYPLTPDVAQARRLVGGRHGTAVLYTCNTPPCPQIAQVVRTNLKAIGIDVDVKTMTTSALYARIARKGEPFDIALIGWVADFQDPADFLNLELDGRGIGTSNNLDFAYFDDPSWTLRLDAAARLSGPNRYLAYAKLDADLARDAAPWVAFGNATAHDLFSRRMGCQVYQPLYGMDLAALCLRSGK
jgi:YVTN family beta-propeller protein